MSEYCIDADIYSFHITRRMGAIETISVEDTCIVTVNTPISPTVQCGYHEIDIATIYVKNMIGDNCDETVHMIRTALSESVRLYPYINIYVITGTNNLACIKHSLSLFFIKYKKTWYEYHFHAYLLESKRRKMYEDGLRILDDSTMKIPFDEFTVIVHPYEMTAEFQSIYESSRTYSDLLASITTSIKTTLDYPGEASWIDVFIQYVFQFDPNAALWAIKKDYECPS